MSRRGWVMAAVGLAVGLAAIARSARRDDDVTVARAVPAASSPGPTTLGARQPTLEVAPVAAIAGDAPDEAAAPDAVAVAKVDGVAFARQYADALCACTAAACLDQVRDRYARRAGEAQASHDARALHDAFVRGQACIRTVRATSTGTGG